MERTIQKLIVSCVLFGALFVSHGARAQDSHFGPSDYSPSVFTYAFDGFWAGALVGTAGGYLVARKDDFAGPTWRPFALGAGIGALAGAGVGLTLGFIDLASERPGIGGVVVRDTFAGATFGLLVGAIGGALAVIKTRDAEHIGFGAAIGTVAGAGAGMIIGFIEGPRIVNSPAHRYPGARLMPSFALLGDGRGGALAVPGVRGSF